MTLASVRQIYSDTRILVFCLFSFLFARLAFELFGKLSKRSMTGSAWLSSRSVTRNLASPSLSFSVFHREISREGLFLPLRASRFVGIARRQQDALEASKSFRVYAHEITRDSWPQVLGISYMAANVVVSYLRCCSKCEVHVPRIPAPSFPSAIFVSMPRAGEREKPFTCTFFSHAFERIPTFD